MDISEFIKETIRQVSIGIELSARECSQIGAVVNPTISVGEDGCYYIPLKPSSVAMQRRVQKIDFDIAVEVTESEETGGEGGVSLHVFTAKGNLTNKTINSTINRVSFSVPICLPSQDCFDE